MVQPNLRSIHTIISRAQDSSIYEKYLINAHQAEGLEGVFKAIRDILTSSLIKTYQKLNIEYNGEVSFSTLEDKGLIDRKITVNLIATYLAIEQALDELEELELMDEKEALYETLKEIASMLHSIVSTLAVVYNSSAVTKNKLSEAK